MLIRRGARQQCNMDWGTLARNPCRNDIATNDFGCRSACGGFDCLSCCSGIAAGRRAACISPWPWSTVYNIILCRGFFLAHRQHCRAFDNRTSLSRRGRRTTDHLYTGRIDGHERCVSTQSLTKIGGFAKNIPASSKATCTQVAKTSVGGNANPAAHTLPFHRAEKHRSRLHRQRIRLPEKSLQRRGRRLRFSSRPRTLRPR